MMGDGVMRGGVWGRKWKRQGCVAVVSIASLLEAAERRAELQPLLKSAPDAAPSARINAADFTPPPFLPLPLTPPLPL